MVKVTKEESLESKGVSAFKFDVVRDPVKDKAIYEAGIQAEHARFDAGSFAQQLFSKLFPHPVTKP